ncbi:MAG: hypothetical protein ISR64_10720 [Deltaproteobacteria bacterium]|nr:hypothetical protein [Deltaproteobacteria bacterium]
MSGLKKRRHRRKLYAGGALMVLAPFGVAGCGADQDDGTDVVSEAPDGYLGTTTCAASPRNLDEVHSVFQRFEDLAIR